MGEGERMRERSSEGKIMGERERERERRIFGEETRAMKGNRRSMEELAGDFNSLSLRSPASDGREILPPAAAAEEAARMDKVGRKKDFKCMERVKGRMVNVLQGLELHTGVFSAAEQKRIVDCIYDLQEKGRRGKLRERTYSEPRKWMKGKGRVTLQFGCCYNYAVDKDGNPPGIIRGEEVDPIPPLLKQMIKRMVAWGVLPPTCIPNSCIVNIYDKDDCIPPHIDHHDFVRPFCTVSFLSECSIVFGAELKIIGPGVFSGQASIPLPLGSVLVLSGNGADVAKHCVPAVPAKRISITFRKMDESKIPFDFVLDPDLENLSPLPLLRKQQGSSMQTPPRIETSGSVRQQQGSILALRRDVHQEQTPPRIETSGSMLLSEDDFPPLSATSKGSGRSRR